MTTRRDHLTKRTVPPIGLLLLIALVGITDGLITLPEREDRLASGSVERAGREGRSRIDALVQGYELDLKEEGVFIRAHDTLPHELVLARWVAVLESHWPLRAVRLSDDAGHELALFRNDSAWTVIGSPDSLHGARVGRDRMWPGIPGQRVHAQAPSRDPRTEGWFVSALKDRTGGVVWSSSRGDGGDLQASLLLRGARDGRFQVLTFVLNAAGLFDLALARSPKEQVHLMLDVDGRPIMDRSDTGALHTVMDQLLERWRKAPSPRMHRVEHGGTPYFAQVSPYMLTGETLELATVIDGRRIHGWLAPLRAGLWMALAVVLLLIAMLILALRGQRASAERLRRQEQQNRTQQRRLAKAIGERDVLDREVHHRVKNNLQVVSSLLNLQARRIPEGATRDEFMRGKRRIDHMALVHKKLYATQDLRSIDLNVLFTELATELHTQHFPQSRGISTAVDADGIHADPDTAIELGIILCELLANSFGHAFPYATGGHIDIKVRQLDGDEHMLEVSDNGTGMRGDPKGDTQLGLEIVEALAQQLDGSLDVRSGKGVTCTVRFRMMHPA